MLVRTFSTNFQLVDCSYIATGPLTIDDGYSTASRG
jgi:hypothetical protein